MLGELPRKHVERERVRAIERHSAQLATLSPPFLAFDGCRESANLEPSSSMEGLGELRGFVMDVPLLEEVATLVNVGADPFRGRRVYTEGDQKMHRV